MREIETSELRVRRAVVRVKCSYRAQRPLGLAVVLGRLLRTGARGTIPYARLAHGACALANSRRLDKFHQFVSELGASQTGGRERLGLELAPIALLLARPLSPHADASVSTCHVSRDHRSRRPRLPHVTSQQQQQISAKTSSSSF